MGQGRMGELVDRLVVADQQRLEPRQEPIAAAQHVEVVVFHGRDHASSAIEEGRISRQKKPAAQPCKTVAGLSQFLWHEAAKMGLSPFGLGLTKRGLAPTGLGLVLWKRVAGMCLSPFC